MNAKESDRMLEQAREKLKQAMPELTHTPGLSMFNDKYDTVVAVPVAALASAEEQAQKSPDSE